MRLPALPAPGDLARLLDQLRSAVPRALALLDAAEGLLDDTRALLGRIDDTRVAADVVVAATDVTRARADEALTALEEPSQRMITLLDALEPSLLRLQPLLARLADTTSPAEVDAVVGLVDRLPMLTDRVEKDLLPMLSTLSNVGPDVHDLLLASQQLNELLTSLPGMGRIRKRIEEDD